MGSKPKIKIKIKQKGGGKVEPAGEAGDAKQGRRRRRHKKEEEEPLPQEEEAEEELSDVEEEEDAEEELSEESEEEEEVEAEEGHRAPRRGKQKVQLPAHLRRGVAKQQTAEGDAAARPAAPQGWRRKAEKAKRQRREEAAQRGEDGKSGWNSRGGEVRRVVKKRPVDPRVRRAENLLVALEAMDAPDEGDPSLSARERKEAEAMQALLYETSEAPERPRSRGKDEDKLPHRVAPIDFTVERQDGSHAFVKRGETVVLTACFIDGVATGGCKPESRWWTGYPKDRWEDLGEFTKAVLQLEMKEEPVAEVAAALLVGPDTPLEREASSDQRGRRGSLTRTRTTGGTVAATATAAKPPDDEECAEPAAGTAGLEDGTQAPPQQVEAVQPRPSEDESAADQQQQQPAVAAPTEAETPPAADPAAAPAAAPAPAPAPNTLSVTATSSATDSVDGSGILDTNTDIRDGNYQEMLQQGLESCMLQRFDHAISMFKRCRQMNLSDPTPAYNLACCYSLKRDVESGIRWLTVAVDLGLDYEDLAQDPVRRCDCVLEVRQYLNGECALQDLENMFSHPSFQEVWDRMRNLSVDQEIAGTGRQSQSRPGLDGHGTAPPPVSAALQQQLQSAPSVISHPGGVGGTYGAMGQQQNPPHSRGSTTGSIEGPDSVFESRLQDGVEAVARGDTAEAVRHFESCLKLRPEDAACAYNLTCCHALMGQAGPAVQVRLVCLASAAQPIRAAAVTYACLVLRLLHGGLCANTPDN
eukprot:COSAG01_NODE_272_length_19747_cov_298.524023_5_plen_756_part_00